MITEFVRESANNKTRAGSTVLGGMCLVWRARLALRAVMPASKIYKSKRSEPWAESVDGAVATLGLKQRQTILLQ
jgi:hypothetical protein